jgi:hypothetical protein
MGKHINCETFQIRPNGSRLTVKRGLAVTEINGDQFIDPQIEPHYNTSLGPADPEHLMLQLSDTIPPRVDNGKVYRFSIEEEALNEENDLTNFRVKRVVRRAGSLALVSVVDHSGLTAMHHGAWNLLQRHEYRTGGELYGGSVEIGFLKPGEAVTISRELGSFFSDVHRFDIRYMPDFPNVMSVSRTQREF